jgi:hypothetical protein
MHSVEAIASRVTEYIQSQPTKTVPGTQIAQFLRFAFPGFTPYGYGTPKLHQFLYRFVRDVMPVGKSGGDVVYGIRASQLELNIEKNVASPPTARETSFSLDAQTTGMNRQLWKSFSSPSSLWVIFANTETGQIEVIPPGGSKLALPWIVIPPCPADKHRQIAERFVASQSDEKRREGLNAILSQPRWWDQMYAATLQMGILRDWQVFRRREILKLFSEALAETKIPAKPRLPIYSNPPLTLQSQSSAAGAEQPRPVDEEELLRRAVISVVQKMSISELRNLAIPVGNLMDELRRGT